MAGIEALVGNNATLSVNTGTVDVPVWVQIAFQRGLTNELTREAIDASHKGSDMTKSVPGRMSGTLSLEALAPDPDYSGDISSHAALEDAMINKQPILVRTVKVGAEGTTITREAEALVITMSEEDPDNDVAIISLELTLLEPFVTV
jgi:hypothetical protein